MDPSHSDLPAAMPTVRDAIAEDIRWGWPGAELWHDNALHDGHVFWIQAAGRNYLLELGERAKWHAMVRDDALGLVDALRAQRWIEILLEHGRACVGLVENEYVLRPNP